jgi:hypothetical protein
VDNYMGRGKRKRKPSAAQAENEANNGELHVLFPLCLLALCARAVCSRCLLALSARSAFPLCWQHANINSSHF